MPSVVSSGSPQRPSTPPIAIVSLLHSHPTNALFSIPTRRPTYHCQQAGPSRRFETQGSQVWMGQWRERHSLSHVQAALPESPQRRPRNVGPRLHYPRPHLQHGSRWGLSSSRAQGLWKCLRGMSSDSTSTTQLSMRALHPAATTPILA